jgi:hypothetical protein
MVSCLGVFAFASCQCLNDDEHWKLNYMGLSDLLMLTPRNAKHALCYVRHQGTVMRDFVELH